MVVLSLVLVVGTSTCARTKKGQPAAGTAQAVQTGTAAPAAQPPSAQEASSAAVEIASPPAQKPSDLGRGDPFMPLVMEAQVTGVTVSPAIPPPPPAVRLTVIINKTLAVFEVGGVSKFAFIGDMIAGLRVADIRKGEVILTKGTKTHTVTLGVLPKSIIASASK